MTYRSRENRKWYQDDYGWKLPVMGGAVALCVVVLCIVVTGFCAWAQTNGCHARLDAYRVNGHYNFWANTCFAELPGGAVNADNLRQDSKGYTLYTPDLPPQVNR